MPVAVSLLDLVCVAGTRHLWPAEFASFVAAMEEKPGERTAFGACADWLDEHEEKELARGFRLISKNPNVKIESYALQTTGREPRKLQWDISGLPQSLRNVVVTNRPLDSSTLAGAVALVALKIRTAVEELT